jgi:chemotaxis protein CheX
MTPPALAQTTELPVTATDVADIAGQVWESFLGLPLVATGAPAAPAGRDEVVMTGVVGITGAWQGSVVLRCSAAHATAAAEAMFAAEPGTLGPDEVADALGELTNMVGGNVKSLLPEPCALSIPSVSGGTGHSVFVPAARPVLEVGLVCGDAPVLVTVWQA